MIDDEVVNGVIDEVTFTCPDDQQKSRLLSEGGDDDDHDGAGGKTTGKTTKLPTGPKSIADFLKSNQLDNSVDMIEHAAKPVSTARAQMIYLMDTKTRQSKTLPSSSGNQLRPVYMQLMLYRVLFSSMISNRIAADRLFQRYRLDPDATFSDGFLAQMCQIDESSPTAHIISSSQESVSEVFANNTLRLLWSSLTREVQIFLSSDVEIRISPFLTAEYRSAAEGKLIGRHGFVFNQDVFNAYIADKMRWWKGERETKGVEIEEAFKCRICEFAPKCTWRAAKADEVMRKAKTRRESSTNPVDSST